MIYSLKFWSHQRAQPYAGSIRVLPQFVQLHPFCTKIYFLDYCQMGYIFHCPLIIAWKKTISFWFSSGTHRKIMYIKFNSFNLCDSPINYKWTLGHTCCVHAPLSYKIFIINTTDSFQINFLSETLSSGCLRIIGANFKRRQIKI